MLSVLTKRKPDTAEPATASTGLWQLAMRRLKRDRIAMFSLLIVLFYLVLLILSSTGLIAKDWNKEVAVSYAPPTFMGLLQYRLRKVKHKKSKWLCLKILLIL